MYLLLDAGFLNNYRYYATKIWFKNANPDDYPEDELNYSWTENKVFLDKYRKMYKEYIKKMIKKFKIKPENIFIACDCKKKYIWRLPLYENYKANRDKIKEKKNVGSDIQGYTYNVLIPEVANELKVNILKCNSAEADDIIAITTKYIRSNFPIEKVIIIATDMDYLQLVDDKQFVDVQDAKYKSIVHKSIGTNEQDLIYKIILGDSSDNIYSCFKRCGKKTALKYALDPEELEKAFTKTPDARQRFLFNKKIIDFNFIPDEIVNSITKELKTFIPKKRESNQLITNFLVKQI